MIPPTSSRPKPIAGWDLWSHAWVRAHKLRHRWYETRRHHLPRPVVSVGNLHWGGTGKTPIVAAIATHWRDQGYRVAILSRGYGRSSKGPLLVSRGQGPIVDVQSAGDEPFLHAQTLSNVAVVVAESRYDGGLLALEELTNPPDLFLLDDGFSHLALARDIDLLVLPRSDPWGNARLPPAGRLREPLTSSARASAVLISGFEARSKTQEIRPVLQPFGFAGPVFACEPIASLTPSAPPLAPSTPLLLVTGIARAHRVLASARQLDLNVVDHLEFPDHHNYPKSSLQRIRTRFEETQARHVLTTTKDRVKLGDRLDIPLTELLATVSLPEELLRWLTSKVEDLLIQVLPNGSKGSR